MTFALLAVPVYPVVHTLIVKRKPDVKVSLSVFNHQTVFSFCLLFYILKKSFKKLLRNLEYSKSLKKTQENFSTEARPKFLIKECIYFSHTITQDISILNWHLNSLYDS